MLARAGRAKEARLRPRRQRPMPPPPPGSPHGPAAAAQPAEAATPLQLLDLLPDELVLLVASFLSGRDAVQLGRTCRRLHVVTRDDTLWRQLFMNDFSISFGLKNRTWFEVYRLPRNRDVCPHLNSLTASTLRSKRAVLALHASQRDSTNHAKSVPPPPMTTPGSDAHGLPSGPTISRPRCRDCRPASLDLWLCLTAECNHIGCGRRQTHQHAKTHASSTEHPLSARTTTNELWCYACHKWVGGENEPELERARNLEIVSELAPTALDMQLLRRRQQDRAAWSRLRAGDAFFLIAETWFDHWTHFIMGDEPPPPPALLRSQRDLHEAVMNDVPVMFNIDYFVVNENNWRYLQSTYGVAPELAEVDIVNDIVLSTLTLVRNNL